MGAERGIEGGEHYHVWTAKRSQGGLGRVYVFTVENRNAGREGVRADYVFTTRQAAHKWAAARWPERSEWMVKRCDLASHLCPSGR